MKQPTKYFMESKGPRFFPPMAHVNYQDGSFWQLFTSFSLLGVLRFLVNFLTLNHGQLTYPHEK